MINKLINSGNIIQLENKILDRLKSRKLVFGNLLQLAELKVLNIINDIKYNPEYFKECMECGELISISRLTEVDEELICEECLEEHYQICNECGDYVYIDSVFTAEEEFYCKTCYFKIMQNIYHKHIIKHELIKQLKQPEDMEDNILYNIDFKINNYIFNIEAYGGSNYRLGSWGANCWYDLGNNKRDLFKAIDYQIDKRYLRLEDIKRNTAI